MNFDIKNIKKCPWCELDDNFDIEFSGTYYQDIRYAQVVCECGAKGPLIDTEDEYISYNNQEELMKILANKAIDAWNKEEEKYE